MSAPQATIPNFLNLRLGDLRNIGVGVGLDVRGSADRIVGMARSSHVATSDAGLTVEAVAVTTHKWAAKVGKYNDDPIWAEVFQSIQDNRRRLKEELNDLA